MNGFTREGVEYTLESPEVVKFKELFPDVTDEAAIGSVIDIHNNIVDGHGEEVPGDGQVIVKMISEKMLANSETVEEATTETQNNATTAAPENIPDDGEEKEGEGNREAE